MILQDNTFFVSVTIAGLGWLQFVDANLKSEISNHVELSKYCFS